MLTAALFGTAPALRASRTEPIDALRQARGSSHGGRFGLGAATIVLQVALAFTLVGAAGLFGRTFAILAARDVGLDRDRVLVMNVGLGERPPAEHALLASRVLEAIRPLADVERAGISMDVPGGNSAFTPRLELQNGTPLPWGGGPDDIFGHEITPGWLQTMGTAVRAGRDFEARDDATAPAVVMVNEAFARKHFPGRNPVGQLLFELRFDEPGRRRPMEIVGVVENAMYRFIRETPPATVYTPVAQGAQIEERTGFYVAIRSAAGSPLMLRRAVAEAVGRVDRDLTLTFRTLADQVSAQYTQGRLQAILSAFFGGLALLLAALGLYGMTAFSVGRRRKEMGIRIALGATGPSVARLVIGRVSVLVGLGILTGAVVSFWTAAFARSLLFETEPRDPVTLAGAAAVLIAAAALAAGVPARQASRVDPAELLRES